MKFVTIPMVARHVGRTPQAVNRALKMAGLKPQRTPGVKGLRLTVKQADEFISRQWPEVPSMKEQQS